MRIVSIGGGPAGLYFALLMKRAHPDTEITVHERNRADDTFGWGVVFSSETLGHFRDADAPTYDAIAASFVRWDDIETWYGGTCVTSTGHGFCGLSRKALLRILQARCAELGVRMRFESDVDVRAALPAADLVLGADGVHSAVRERFAAQFHPRVELGRCRFAWLGTTLPLRAFTFLFRENEHGLFTVHAYPFQKDLSTWIVECHEDTWRRAGLDRASEPETAAYCERLFADHLGSHRLLMNRSVWRQFPTVRNDAWRHREGATNVVLLGDAAHTAHFSIGSGTKLAMEDAIALADAFRRLGTRDVPAALAAYEDARRDDVRRLQRAADVSREWFEECARWIGQPPTTFAFNLMTRSHRITFDGLRARDPARVDRVSREYAEASGRPRDSKGGVPVPIFTPFEVRGLRLESRIVVSPMCQYSAVDGMPGEWHLVHLGSRALGGPALVFAEATGVEPEGRITHGCTGLWSEAHARAWARIVSFVHERSRAKVGMQLAHAGRKGSAHHPWEGDDRPLADDERPWPLLAPSAIPLAAGWPTPRAMDRADMDRVRDAFVRATLLAETAGFDWLELHMAHGYLLSSFLSPLTNRREDEHGGPLENRMRFPLEVFRAVRAAWPSKPISVRLSATDWVEDGFTPADAVEVSRALRDEGCDMVDVSSGGNVPWAKPVYGRMYQVPFADRIRHEARVPVIAVGGILGPDHANTVLAAGRADLCALARPHLYDPYLALHAARRYGYPDLPWPGPYALARTALEERP
jgi:anthraniloyl-CoA monooxygenase